MGEAVPWPEWPVCHFDDLADRDARGFEVGEGEWPFRGFVVRQGDRVYAYQNFCVHVGHPLNWVPDGFFNKDDSAIQCASHGAQYEIDTGLCFAGPCIGKSLRKVDVELRDGVIYATGPVSA